eukprot:CAMPEP_0197529412 /NCGR_PEP_ID=MMETSP1318-20131121/28332_1 /TAXON_ID=552666 /ORGANISM="Partenskyella glossopodia, Strain RCC365" /LENGTH=243 /DNA_ID=CAMNT_0043084865 /DNA_START=32 /DNA_END=760 /DNA_ORIENTATION=-
MERLESVTKQFKEMKSDFVEGSLKLESTYTQLEEMSEKVSSLEEYLEDQKDKESVTEPEDNEDNRPLVERIEENRSVLNVHRDWISTNIKDLGSITKELGSIREWISRIRSLLRDERNNGQYATSITDKFNKKIEGLRRQIGTKIGRHELKNKATVSDIKNVMDYVQSPKYPLTMKSAVSPSRRCGSCARTFDYAENPIITHKQKRRDSRPSTPLSIKSPTTVSMKSPPTRSSRSSTAESKTK